MTITGIDVKMKRIVDEIKIRITANTHSVEIAKNIVWGFIKPENPCIDVASDIIRAVIETVENCVIHAYKTPSSKGYIYISARIYDNQEFSIEVSDNGCGFDATKLASDGMGFVVMRNFMDSVSFKSKIGKGTTVLMRKSLARESEDTE